MRRLVLVGACYLDTILSVPHYPAEDAKLRATSIQVRRGGNCPNSLEVLQQLLGRQAEEAEDDMGTALEKRVAAFLVACLPEADAPATRTIWESLRVPPPPPPQGYPQPYSLSFDHCLYRAGHATPASSYIIRSAATGSRTIVNYNDLPEMTAEEFAAIVDAFNDTAHGSATPTWWHFEGRIPETTLACIRYLRRKARFPHTVSVEVEKPGREGLRELASEADVVFHSKTWAVAESYASAEECLRGEMTLHSRAELLFCTWGEQGASALARPGRRLFTSPVPAPLPASKVIDTIGAGDTFVAGVLFKLACCSRHAAPKRIGDGEVGDQEERWAPPAFPDDVGIQQTLDFAVDLATRKVQIDGFRGLVWNPPQPSPASDARSTAA